MKATSLSLIVALISLLTFSCNTDDGLVSTNNNDNTDNTDNSTDCNNSSSTFSINLDPNDCQIDIAAELGTSSQYEESITGTTRNITINGIASHNVGTFPNNGNPNTIRAISKSYQMTTNPSLASNITQGQGYEFGILFSGATMDPYTAEFFQTSTGGFNREWNITTLTNAVNLGLDCNNAHVQPTGKYHYHGTPSAYVDELGIDGSKMVKVGYAGDGFPIYYKYVFDDSGDNIITMESAYELKDGSRPGDGDAAPDGCYDGMYFQDYEYVEGKTTLDECNGMFGITPDAPGGEYFYVITDNFPSLPLCFSGSPDNSFKFF